MTEEQKINTEKLIQALRGDKYKQGCNFLRNNDSFCCLGVACDLSGLYEWEFYEDKNNYIYRYNFDFCYLPQDVMKYYGFKDKYGKYKGKYEDISLSTHNDNGVSFEKIADIIEKELNNDKTTMFE